jgi:hypothetical protein
LQCPRLSRLDTWPQGRNAALFASRAFSSAARASAISVLSRVRRPDGRIAACAPLSMASHSLGYLEQDAHEQDHGHTNQENRHG